MVGDVRSGQPRPDFIETSLRAVGIDLAENLCCLTKDFLSFETFQKSHLFAVPPTNRDVKCFLFGLNLNDLKYPKHSDF